MMQRIRQRIRKRPWMVPALLLVLVFAMGLLVEAIRPLGVFAAHTDQRVSDPPTNASQDYEDALGSTSSTRYNGRVWADKTVYTSDATTGDTDEGFGPTIEIGEEDFLLSYSLMATTTVVEGQSLVPLDVVFVIDLSDSMKGDKIKETVLALNQSVHTLMMSNPDTRIGVVTYNDEAYVLLPLDHYTKVSETEDYFSLSETGDSLKVAVKNSEGNIITKPTEEDNESVTMGQWTNIHMGIDMGMDMLLGVSKDDTTTTSGEARYPALMLMSDGAPTASGSDDSDWWDPSGVRGDGLVNRTGVDALKAIMNASYQKKRVSEYYGTEMQVYTVGVGEESLNAVAKAMAQATLNPQEGLNSPYTNEMRSAWETYLENQGSEKKAELDGYVFNHPENGDIDSVYYNDGYYSAENASDIAGAFEQVLNQIIVSGAVPTEVGEDPTKSGYITYVDTIGEYMEVTEIKALIWEGYDYEVIKVGETFYDSTDGDVAESTIDSIATYAVKNGLMTSPIYGVQNMNEIVITVTTYKDGNQTLEVKVPAALIPLRVNTVTLNDDGTVQSNTCTNNYPLQLFYTVSLREYVTKPSQIEDDNTICGNPNRIVVEIPTGEVLPSGEQKTKTYVNLAALTDEYIRTHTNSDGTIRFYPNLYTGQTEDQAGVSATVGDAYVTFDPATTNPFYSVQQDTLLYSDSGCNTPATDINGPLYVKVPYYDGTKLTFDALERTGMYQLGDDGEVKMVDRQLYLKAGVRANLHESVMEKGKDEHGVSNNRSGTADTFRYPIYQIGEPEGDIKVWLGNNGVENLPVLTGDLNISKTVTGNKGELDKGFVFDITVQRNETKPTGMFEATKTTTTDTGTTSESISVEFNQGKAQVILQHNQSITIHGLPSGFTYTVTEQDPAPDKDANIYNGEDYVVSAIQNGKTVEWTEGATYICTGIIACLETSEVAYTNDLNVPLVDYSFTKVDGEGFDQSNLEDAILLPGAQFTLYHYTGDDWDTDSGVLLDTTQTITNWETVMTVTSDKDGVVLMKELQAGRYRLVETKAPDGYKLPKGQWNLQISRNEETGLWSFDIEAVKDAAKEAPAMALVNGKFYLMNYKPINPPITGGDGGEDFRIGGGLLMFTGLVLAMWWMWSSPRRRSEFL